MIYNESRLGKRKYNGKVVERVEILVITGT